LRQKEDFKMRKITFAALLLTTGPVQAQDLQYQGDVTDIRVIRRVEQHPQAWRVWQPFIIQGDKQKHLIVAYGAMRNGKKDMGDIFAAISKNDGKSLILGSMNWTAAGESKNDENVVLLHDVQAGSQFRALFEEMWESIPDRWLAGRPDSESMDSVGSASDGIDNDFDGLIDMADPGCGENPPSLPSLPPFHVVPLADGYSLIKGNISASGKRIFHVPGSKYYEATRITKGKGERWFPSTIEAQDAGWRGSRAR
jgi:hypothetical protein